MGMGMEVAGFWEGFFFWCAGAGDGDQQGAEAAHRAPFPAPYKCCGWGKAMCQLCSQAAPGTPNLPDHLTPKLPNLLKKHEACLSVLGGWWCQNLGVPKPSGDLRRAATGTQGHHSPVGCAKQDPAAGSLAFCLGLP